MSNETDRNIEQLANAIKARQWDLIKWADFEYLLQWPVSETLHAQFNENDEALLLELADADDVPKLGRNFGIRLLGHIRSPLVKALFLRKWEEAEKEADYKLQMEFLCWRLTDYDDLAEEMHKRIFEEVLKNFGYFKEQFIFFIGGEQDQVLDAVKQRLNQDPRFPGSKDWLYLCAACAALEPRRKELMALLEEHTSRSDFTGEVARRLNDLI